MARPRSEEKRQAILLAATRLFAEEGLGASTARIAREAGVAEGTLFTYFATKDDLMNQLYLDLKGQLRAALVSNPDPSDLQEQVWRAWQTYVTWGMAHPEAHQALAKLGLSTRVTDSARALANQAFCDVAHLLESARAQGTLRDQPPSFAGALLGAMADVTMAAIQDDPIRKEAICRAGFTAFWKAITTP